MFTQLKTKVKTSNTTKTVKTSFFHTPLTAK